ncbi:MAG: PRC-barrel domain-containing protein, partial [Candidatus Hadarchaeaceae archaeon]
MEGPTKELKGHRISNWRGDLMKRLSELNGLKVYSDRARYVGTVEDALIDDRDGAVIGLVFGRKGDKVLS